ncbi:CdaR family transcriptional regulator [Staphylococcus ureilyticus]|uniref:CdaR family transcriptional regulator n=1 Tax=Staphylococcus TaxID=1279 RepID=UPI0008A20A37|nr:MULTISPECIES: sugar diacid recognition domain-containing protein [Staphylococcus]MDK7753641.1 sugar diacid recognition domain-containing protein [Staphylococcus sp. UMB10092B]OFQ95698.1 transcriptional regulator [Staphylococcus sp. HMSC065A08]OHO39945.1 transcriptional regulator [Staphylococcus sp. HMSC034G07]OLF32819.1 transcriptional regulator [Staphylococcus sp. 47.1]
MDILTEEMATLIVNETAKRTKTNINIMNFNGVIIASFDKRRIGTLHEGAIEVLKQEKTVVINQKDSLHLKGTQAGINLPIIFQDNIVGVIGITGNPSQITHVAELVKMSTELLLYQNYFTYELEGQIRSQELFIEELLKSESSKSFIQYLMKQLNIDLLTYRKCIIIDIEKQIFSRNSIVRSLTSRIDARSFTIAFTNYNRIVILATAQSVQALDNKINHIYQIFQNLELNVQMASSLMFKRLKDFKNAYEECELVFMLAENEKVVTSFEDIEEKTLLYQIDKNIRERFKKRILSDVGQQSIDTLKSFFENDLNITQTAKKLYIHRNTLLYRLEKCEKETGLNPKKYSDAVKLQIAIWC